jgi:hypothetical protein
MIVIFSSIEIMLVRKQKEGTVSDNDGATGAHLVGARPVEHGCGSYFGSVKELSNRSWGSRGLDPWAASPSGGERGSPSQFPRQTFMSIICKRIITLSENQINR